MANTHAAKILGLTLSAVALAEPARVGQVLNRCYSWSSDCEPIPGNPDVKKCYSICHSIPEPKKKDKK